MKTYYTSSDVGALLFGNEAFSFHLHNNYGDGENKILVFDSKEEFMQYMKTNYRELCWYKYFKYQTNIQGAFNLYSYDCSNMRPEDIVAKFDGKYEVHLRSSDYEQPTFAIVKK